MFVTTFSFYKIFVLEITAILTIASCPDTWKLFKLADAENILHLAISGIFTLNYIQHILCLRHYFLETDCPRLPPTQGYTIPTVIRGEELPQILLDLRSIKAYDWKSVVMLYDDSLGIKNDFNRYLIVLTDLQVVIL